MPARAASRVNPRLQWVCSLCRSGLAREEAIKNNIKGGSMTDQPLALTVEQGLHTEQELLAAFANPGAAPTNVGPQG